MRLLFVSNVFPNRWNPTKGTFNAALLAAVAEKHAVHVVSPVSWLEAARHRVCCTFSPRNATVRSFPYSVEYPVFYYPPKVLRHQYGKFLWWSIQKTLRQAIQQYRPEAVFSYWAHPDGEAAGRAAREAGLPAITMVGGSDVLLLARTGTRRGAILEVLQNSQAVVTVSQHLSDQLVRDGLDPQKLHVVHRGVNRDVFFPGNRIEARQRLGLPLERPVLVAVGRLVPVKGFDLLITACATLVRQGHNPMCCILGGGELRPALQAQIQAAGLQNHVRLVGSQPQERLADWYRAADLAVLTSHSEGIPNVLLEAMSCGTPFVATRVGGVPEIADSRYHTLVPPNDPAALAVALAERLSKVSTAEDQDGLTGGIALRWQPSSWNEAAERLVNIVERSVEQPFAPIEKYSGMGKAAHQGSLRALSAARCGMACEPVPQSSRN